MAGQQLCLFVFLLQGGVPLNQLFGVSLCLAESQLELRDPLLLLGGLLLRGTLLKLLQLAQAGGFLAYDFQLQLCMFQYFPLIAFPGLQTEKQLLMGASLVRLPLTQGFQLTSQ